MAVTIVPYEASFEPAVASFNGRLRAGGAAQRFPEKHVPAWLPPAQGRTLFFEFFLAVENEATVRGCYALKHQEYWIGGQQQSIGYLALPLSEGIVNRSYTAIGAQLLLHAIRRQPMMYVLGMGGQEEAITHLVRAAGWRVVTVPFYFQVVHPFAFLRNIRILRRSRLRRFALDALALSGTGWVIGKGANFALSCGAPSHRRLAVEEVDEFSDWADELWQACASEYRYCAVRDAATLRILYPKENSRFIRLRIAEAGRWIGWAVLLATDLKDHKQFGNMRLGSIVDAFARPADAEKIVFAAQRLLWTKAVDLMVLNQSHACWCRALKKCGFLAGPSNFLLGTSRKLTETLDRLQIVGDMLYLDRGDGDGPINL
jgi:hypothetical protein